MPYLGKQPANVPVTADDIPDNSITSAKILDNVITISDIGANAVGNSEMADDAVGVAELSASGTASNTTFLRGDNAWAVVNTNLVADTSPQLGGNLDLNSNDITGTGGIPAGNLTGSIAAARLTAATTQAESDNSTKLATTAYVTAKITTLIGGAPSTLNDLNELALAINDDANYNSTLTTALATKLPLAGGTLTGNVTGVKLGLGVAPTNLLHTHGAAGSTFQQFTNNTTGSGTNDGVLIGLAQDDSMLRIENRENSHIRFNTNNAERMRITSAGKVGIGTNAPYTALHIKGAASGQSAVNSSYNNFTIENDSTAGMSILTGTSSTGAIVFGDSGDNDIGKIEYAHSGNSMRFTVNAAEAMRITDNGTIGIGNNIPNTFSVNANNLVVGTGTGSEGMTIYSGNSSAGNIFFADSADNNEETRGGISYQHNGNKMQFRVNDANKMEIMSDGKVGIGHTAPPSQLTIQGGVEYRTAPAPGSGTLDIRDTGAEGGAGPVGNHGGGIVLGITAGNGFCGIKGGLGHGGGNTAGHMKFYTRGAHTDTHMTERMRIEYDGSVLVKSFATNGSTTGIKIDTSAGTQTGILSSASSTATRMHMTFVNPNGEVGFIKTTNSGTAFATSSDYRLKENVNYTWDATTRLKQLKPARFNFIADDTITVDGFLAHEAATVVPESVIGTKDAVTAEVLYVEGDVLPEGKAVGDVKTALAPDYQGIDQSKLVPLLVKTIQELEARITALEA